MSKKYWEKEDFLNKYYLGDCLEILPNIPDNVFDLIIIDPPNLILAKHFATRVHFRRTFGDLGLIENFYKNFFKEFERVIKDEGLFYIFCSESSYPIFWYYCYPFTKKIRCLVWDKISSFNGYHWRHQHELILFGLMPNSPKIPTGDGDILKCRAVPKDDREHPAQKPEQLIDELILKSSKNNYLIGDFFSGSAVVLKCAKRIGRNYFGIEYDKDYYEKSKKQLENIKLITTKDYIPKTEKTLDNF